MDSEVRVRSRRMWSVVAALVVWATLVSACGDDPASGDGERASGDEVVERLRAGGLSSLASALEDIDLAEMAGSSQFTLFAPDDAAFARLEAGRLAELLGNRDRLEAQLRHHLIAETLAAEELVEIERLTDMSGATLVVHVDDDGVVHVANAALVGDGTTVGGVQIHVVDAFIDPEAAS